MTSAVPPSEPGPGGGGGRRRFRLRWWHAPLALYAGLLVASWIAMSGRGADNSLDVELPEGRDALQARAYGADGQPIPTAPPVRVVYREVGLRDGPPILLLHGSPGSSNDFRSVAPLLADRYRLLTLDLPGFGASTRTPPDVSVRAHAGYCIELLDHFGIHSAHVVGFSMGGGVALEMADAEPDRVRSITMLSALGVEELELLGQHTLNHGIHGLQLASLQAARWLIPHFGSFDRAMLGVPYARNFFDTDQRRLRPILEQIEAPLLILHGADDFLIPVDAAEEHARIVPQAELVVFEPPSNHFLPWSSPDRVAREVASFVDRVDRGEAATRSTATPSRIEAALEPFDPKSLPPFEGPALLAVLALLAVATFVSEDLACIAAGLLVADGRIGFIGASIACFTGIFVGDMGLYLLGRLFGRPALRRRPLSWMISESAVDRASAWFDSKGIAVVFLSRFTPGLRLPTYVAAGVLRTSFLGFALFFAIAGILWTPALVGIAAVAGEQLAAALGGLGARQLPFVLLLVLVLYKAYRILPHLFTHRGRRILRGRWLRLTRWEFWPPYIAYAPLVPWLLWLAIKHRGLTKVTATNPAMPAGGFVGESKAEILAGLDADQPEIASFVLLPGAASPDERLALALDFMRTRALDYPVIIKPDAGQRGSGVGQLRDESHLRERVAALDHDAILQERIDGEEFGVFYTRHPDEPEGSIFGVTVKVLPEVVGDGRRTVEELVLDDPRACAMHATYLDELGARALEVPEAGESVRLVDVGTHARGAIFLEGGHLITPELEAAIERIARRYEGFDFGRFDIRAPSAAHLARGEDLGIIELNGVTSEATNIYDPKHSVLAAYRTLARQWSRAFDIGAANAARGVPTTGLLRILGEWRRYQRAQRSHRAR